MVEVEVQDPEETGIPITTDDECSLLGTSMNDEIFISAPDACYKIFRTWTIIDWCQYDSQADDPYSPENGYWTHTQVIKIIDTEDPLISGPADTVVTNISGDCSDIEVNLIDISTEDCTDQTDMNIHYTVDLYSDDIIDRELEGINASGIYPNGIHTITFIAEDNCNNVGYYTFVLEVKDGKAPIPVLINGLAVDLMNIGNGEGMLEVEASSFDAGSYDNCTVSENLIFSFNENTSATTVIYDCSDVGHQEVEIYVTDEDGNQSLANTYIIIQDNDEFCEDPGIINVQITGLITDVNDNVVGNTLIETSNDEMLETSEVALDGHYIFESIETGYHYDVTPTNNLDPLEGISTLDLLLIQKHILNIDRLDDPFKLIAADINNNQSISATDLVELQKLLLQLIPNFQNNDSWKFIYSGYQFQNPEDPLLEDIPYSYDINILVEDMSIDFTGIKIGDVNHSVSYGINSETQSRNETPVVLTTKDIFVEEGKTYEIAFTVNNENYIEGLQLELQYSSSNISVLDVESNNENSESILNHNSVNKGSDSKLLISCINTQGISNDYFIVRIKAKSNGLLSDFLGKGNTILNSEAYDRNKVIYEVDLRIDHIKGPDDFVLGQNSPNPANSSTLIPVQIYKKGEYAFSIMDITGQVMHYEKKALGKGIYQFDVSLTEYNPGVYLYRISSDSNFRTKRMIIAH